MCLLEEYECGGERGEEGEGQGGHKVGDQEGRARVDPLPRLLVITGPHPANWEYGSYYDGHIENGLRILALGGGGAQGGRPK